MTAIGHIYKIICTVDEKFCYIGSTFNRLSKRFEMHREGYKWWLKTNSKSMSCYPFYEKHGIENFKIVLIKSYEVCREHVKDRRHLEAYETLWICRTKCVNVNMPIQYLIKEKRSQISKVYRDSHKEDIAKRDRKYHEANRERLLINMKAYQDANRDKIRESANQKIECECGCMISKANIAAHRKSNKHINLMTSK